MTDEKPAGSPLTPPPAPPKQIKASCIWGKPQHGKMLIRTAAGELYLLPTDQWDGKREINIPDGHKLEKPRLDAVVRRAQLTEADLAEIFARAGIISPQTITHQAVKAAVQMVMSRIDLLAYTQGD